jgi:cytochrome c-type biogenesis protein CcmH/NrfF
MSSLRTLGGIAGGFLLKTPPKSVLTTLLWIGSRSHPAVATLAVVIVLASWIGGHGDD